MFIMSNQHNPRIVVIVHSVGQITDRQHHIGNVHYKKKKNRGSKSGNIETKALKAKTTTAQI